MAERKVEVGAYLLISAQCKRGGWYKKNGKREPTSEEEKAWMIAIVSGKQKKLMVKPRNEDLWYRSVVDAAGPSPDSVRFGNKKKRKLKLEKSKKRDKSLCEVDLDSKTRRRVNLQPRPVLALAFAAVVAEPSTAAFLSTLAAPRNRRTKARWDSVKRLLIERKTALVDIAIVEYS